MVNEITVGYLGIFWGLLAILGVIAAPITSGDTAFRAIRLTIADRFNISQVGTKNRLLISLPIFAIAFFITQINFAVIWKYFTFSNQMLAAFVLWTAVAYLYKNGRNIWLRLSGALLTVHLFIMFSPLQSFPFAAGYSVATTSAMATSLAIILYLVTLMAKSRKSTCLIAR